jgi:hypothetical protein
MIIILYTESEIDEMFRVSLPVGQDECHIGKFIVNENDDNPEHIDTYSQMAISMESLFSGTEVDDQEFFIIGETLGRWESRFRRNVLNALIQNLLK